MLCTSVLAGTGWAPNPRRHKLNMSPRMVSWVHYGQAMRLGSRRRRRRAHRALPQVRWCTAVPDVLSVEVVTATIPSTQSPTASTWVHSCARCPVR